MTKDEALRMALDAMTISLPRLAPYGEKDWLDIKAAIKACEEALAQPEPEWLGLTNGEIEKIQHLISWTANWSYGTFALAIEAKLKQKNGYSEEKNFK